MCCCCKRALVKSEKLTHTRTHAHAIRRLCFLGLKFVYCQSSRVETFSVYSSPRWQHCPLYLAHANSSQLLNPAFLSTSPDVLSMAAVQERGAAVGGKRELLCSLTFFGFKRCYCQLRARQAPQLQKTELCCRLDPDALNLSIVFVVATLNLCSSTVWSMNE